MRRGSGSLKPGKPRERPVYMPGTPAQSSRGHKYTAACHIAAPALVRSSWLYEGRLARNSSRYPAVTAEDVWYTLYLCSFAAFPGLKLVRARERFATLQRLHAQISFTFETLGKISPQAIIHSLAIITQTGLWQTSNKLPRFTRTRQHLANPNDRIS